jgi:hypothetical protein
MFLSRNDIRIEELPTIKYIYSIEIIKGTAVVSRKKNDTGKYNFDYSVYNYEFPIIYNYALKGIIGESIFYTIYFWIDEDNAIIFHSNTSYTKIPYYKQYKIDMDVDEIPKIDRKTAVTDIITKSTKIVIESKDFFMEFESFNEFLEYILNGLYNISNEKNPT